MRVIDQIKAGIIVSPTTKSRLIIEPNEGNSLLSEQQNESFPMKNSVPDFLGEKSLGQEFQNEEMNSEYRDQKSKTSFFSKVKKLVYGDIYTKRITALIKSFDAYNDSHVLLSIGGGPKRDHPLFTNLNISDYPNVDVIANAHHLPYADNTVDGIFINDVIEHLYNPQQAIAEMFRVLKPGGTVLSVTPFIQPYHGYPHHYQNLTLTGHEYNYQSKGFRIEESGVAIGPIVALNIIISKYFLNFLPNGISQLLAVLFLLPAMLLFRPFDNWLSKHRNAHTLCSATYVLAKKSVE